MSRPQESYNKKEKEKKKLEKRKAKQLRKEERKANKADGNNNMFVYVDENGHLTNTPPDPDKKVEIDPESIVIGIPKKEKGAEEEFDPVRKGKVAFFNDSKGFGFINDADNGEKYFVHVKGLIDEIKENDQVTFELEKGLKGMNAVRVKKV